MPQGAVMITSPLFVHTNPDTWAEPRTFDPTRWTLARADGNDLVEPLTDTQDAAGRPHPRPEDAPPQRYLPFGAGAQSCQGRWFASDEMLTVVRAAVESVELEVVDDGGLLDLPLEEQVVLHVYCRPSRTVRVRVRALGSDDA